MADLTITSTQVKRDEDGGERVSGRAGELITAGMAVYRDEDQDNKWYRCLANGSIIQATIEGIALNDAGVRQTLRIQKDGKPTLGLSAGIVVGTIYGLSETLGGIAPVSDAKVTHYRTIVGCGDADGKLSMALWSTGILPGSILGNSLLKWLFAFRVVDNTALVSPIIDRLGYEEVTLNFATGTIATAGATFTVLLEHGDNIALSDAAAVADVDMISQTPPTAPETAASWNGTHDGQVRALGYLGTKRYLRATVGIAGNAGNADIIGTCLLGYGLERPVVQTPN